MVKVASALAALLATAVYVTEAPAQGVADPARVQAGVYSVDPDHTQVIWAVMHLGISTFYGQFNNVSGTLTLMPNQSSASSLDVSLPVASVFTSSDKLSAELRGPDWLDAARFPQARFQSTSVTPTGPGSAVIAGNLTLHGVTKPLSLNAKFVGTGRNPLDSSRNVGFSATGGFSRSSFGVDKYVPLIGDRVELTISGAFVKKG